jgi:ABC-type phosphate transport system substrate-binding protein
MRRRPLLLLALPALLAGALRAEPTLVIIVNPDSGVTSLSREQAESIFMGRQKRLPSGLLAVPVEQLIPPEARVRFYQYLVHRSVNQVRAYWARLYFSGEAQPPRQTRNSEETLAVIAANRGAIGFVEKGQADRRVRAVLELGGEEDH